MNARIVTPFAAARTFAGRSLCAAAFIATLGVVVNADISPKGIGDEFQITTLHIADAPVHLLAVGRLDETEPGPDLVAVDGNGTILRLNLGHPEWSVQPLPVKVEVVGPPTMRPTLSVGNVRPDLSGDEIVLQTALPISVLAQTAPGQWEVEVIENFDWTIATAWSVRIGDIDPMQPVDEIFYIFEGLLDTSMGLFAHHTGSEWVKDHVFATNSHDGSVGMDAAVGNIDPDHPGNEIVVPTETGPTYAVTPQPHQPGLWPRRLLWDDFDNAGWRVLIADVLPERPGNEIVYGTRYNNRILLSYDTDDGHEMEVLFTGNAVSPQPSMWDIAVGNVDPATPALDIVGVDATGSVYLVQYDGVAWSGRTIWQDTTAEGRSAGLNAVVIDNFLPQCPGDEIIVAGESGCITLISRPNAGPADLNCDGVVDVFDLIELINLWGLCDDPTPGTSGSCPGDLNNDGVVDVFDLIELINSWG